MKLVYVDIETDSLDEQSFQIIQIGAVGVRDNEIVDTFERKLMFDITKSNPEALQGNSYREDLWDKEAVPVELVLEHFSTFLSGFADIKRVSAKGRGFKVCQLAGHNTIRFDLPRLQKLYKDNGKFFPGDYNPIDTRITTYRHMELCIAEQASCFRFIPMGGQLRVHLQTFRPPL